MNKFSVSIVIPTLNRLNYLKNCISSLENQSYPKELTQIIVVDNGSTDGTREWVLNKSNNLNIKYKNVEKINNFEAAKLRNIGIKEADGEILVFIDSDIVVGKDFIKNHVLYYDDERDRKCVIGSVIYLKDNKNHQINLENLESEKERLFDYIDPLESDLLYANENLSNHPIPWMICHSGNISTTKFCIEKYGDFDEWHQRWSIEDIDFGYSLYKNGVKMFFSASSYGLHQYHKTEEKNEKVDSIKEGYKHLIYKNPKDSLLKKVVDIQRSELELISKGKNITHNYKKKMYKFLKKEKDAEYLLPKVTFAIHITKSDLDDTINIIKKLDEQYTEENVFEVIIINSISDIQVEKQIQNLDTKYDLRLFNVNWGKEFIQNLEDGINFKKLRNHSEEFNDIEKNFINFLNQSNMYEFEELKDKYEKYVYKKSLAKFIKFINTNAVIGDEYVKIIFREL
ncbi:glycosyltransferase [uncultured Clostridium sp.]|uniref:glycosyltransferase n=1 Tax=uncultured Clostridium sp. TaxID=59620 RepID=UPI0025F5B5AA|nr:glycosyltransferase [uncultured Clostridium sp.]